MKINIKQWRNMSPDERVETILQYIPQTMKGMVKVK